ncbi:MAG: MATE family efflux transporter [Candidatus Omnitrophica bacterium]|nr:MATE family efflux transporter [Candidatus Omnitrophota bacterium]
MKKINKPGGIKEMIFIALPMVVSHACDTVMVFTDRMFLSKLGSLQMNAAMGGGMSSFVMMSFFLGLTGYSTALVAQYLGSGQKERCASVTMQSLIISFAAYPILLLLKPIMLMIITGSGIDPEQMVYQIIYFNMIIFSIIISLTRSSLCGFFCGIGKTRIVMIAAIVSMFANIILNYIFIFGKLGVPAMGIKGAAIGTILAGICGLGILFGTYFSKKIVQEYNTIKEIVFNKEVMGKLLNFGYPSGLELFLNFTAFTCMTYLFHSRGAIAATATSIMTSWDMVSFVPLLGVEIGVTSLVGRYMGAQRSDIAHQSTMSGLKLGSLYSASIFIIFMFFPEQLVGFFKPVMPTMVYKEAFPIAVTMLRIACLYVFLETLIVTFVGALRGAGDTFWSMCLTVGLHFFIVVVQYVCLIVIGASIVNTWIMIVLSFCLGTFFIYLRYASNKWKTIRVIAPVDELTCLDGFHEIE